MKRFVLWAVIGSMRRALAVVVVLVALPAAIYVGSNKLAVLLAAVALGAVLAAGANEHPGRRSQPSPSV